MRHPAKIASLIILPFLAAGAFAAEGDRYRLEKSDTGGFVRMDAQTGEMSICEERAGQLVCKLAADERAAFQDEIDRMQNAVKALEARVATLENSLTARVERSLPTEEEFEKTMGYMERFFRGFIGIVKELDEEKQPATPEGNKT